MVGWTSVEGALRVNDLTPVLPYKKGCYASHPVSRVLPSYEKGRV